MKTPVITAWFAFGIFFSLIQPKLAFQKDTHLRANDTEEPFYELESRLLAFIFRDYHRDARPARRVDSGVNVAVDMVIMKINELVERSQEIVLNGYLKMTWNDERLIWNPADFGGIERIVVPSSNIWVPDIGLINSADMYSITRDFRFPAAVTSNGMVVWVPAGKLAAQCELDVTYFPFDNQTCFYRFESWSYSNNFLNITGEEMTLSPAHYVPDQQWSVKAVYVNSYVAWYEGEAFGFSRIDFMIHLHRKPLYYVTYTILPGMTLSSLQVCSHLLPVADGNRIAFATTMLIAFSVVHVSISEQMPKTSDSVPLIEIYIYVVMMLIAISLIEAFLTANCLEKAGLSTPPKWLWTFVVGILGRFSVSRVGQFQAKYLELNRLLGERNRVSVTRRSPTGLSTEWVYANGKLSVTASTAMRPNKRCTQNSIVHHSDADKFDKMRPQASSPLISEHQPLTNSVSGTSKLELCQNCKTIVAHSLKSVSLLQTLCDDLIDRQLRELSKDVWNALLSVLDRYLFLVVMSVAIVVPMYLFLVLPPGQ